MGFKIKILSMFIRKIKPTIDVSTPLLINVNILRHHNITCRCKSMAVPICVRGNKYQCIRCDKQVIGSNYNFGYRYITDEYFNVLPKDSSQLLDMTCYDDAIVFLKTKQY